MSPSLQRQAGAAELEARSPNAAQTAIVPPRNRATQLTSLSEWKSVPEVATAPVMVVTARGDREPPEAAQSASVHSP